MRLTWIEKSYSNNDLYLSIIIKMANDGVDIASAPHHHPLFCYWLCNRKAELKVYTDFGNILHLCKRCYEIYDPEHRLKTEEMSSR